MKAKYQGYEAKKSGGYVELPTPGAYVGKILDVKVEKTFDKAHDQIVLMLDITEGDCAGRYMEQYNDAKERFPETKFKGVLRITVPEEDDPEDKAWIRRVFEGNMWAVEQSNDGYAWDWDEKKLKGKRSVSPFASVSIPTTEKTGKPRRLQGLKALRKSRQGRSSL